MNAYQDDPENKKTMQLIFEEIGAMLLVFQHIEYQIGTFLHSVVEEGDADKKLMKVLQRDKATLGTLLEHFEKKVHLPENFAVTLSDLLDRRNLFIHHLSMEPWFDMKSERGREIFANYMKETRKSMGVVIKITISAIQSIPSSEISDQSIARAIYFSSQLDKIIDSKEMTDEEVEKIIQEYPGVRVKKQY